MGYEQDDIPEDADRGWYTVQITKAENGFIVRVGCKTFVFMDWSMVSTALDLYWRDPKKAVELYLPQRNLDEARGKDDRN
jgi:hypothetical protein